MTESIDFYCVRLRSKITVPVSEVTPVTFDRTVKSGETQTRYALRAEVDGNKLVKFVRKDLYDEIKGEE